MKKSFSILEIIIVILLLSLAYSTFSLNSRINKSNEFTNKLILYLKQTRYQALVNSKFNLNDEFWYKSFWTLKFFRCRSSIGGLYFSIYSDKNKTGHVSKIDTLKDPLTNKYLYSSNYCQENNSNNPNVLLTKNYNIQDINISCNSTNSLGQISFSDKSQVFTKLSNYKEDFLDFQLNGKCIIEIVDKIGNTEIITIHGKTGYIEKKRRKGGNLKI